MDADSSLGGSQSISLIFPHQLFEHNPCISLNRTIYLVEEFLFFRQYNFHKQKLAFQRASMKFYEKYLLEQNFKVVYIESTNPTSDIRKLIPYLAKQGVKEIHYCDVVDNWLELRLKNSSESQAIVLREYDSPNFLNTKISIEKYYASAARFNQTDFYREQRKKSGILVDKAGKPVGGKWTFDSENRLRYPTGKKPPEIKPLGLNNFYSEAFTYVNQHFPNNIGVLNERFIYPTTFAESRKWLQNFLETRLVEYGPYQDAIVDDQNILHHSLISPMLNVGLLTPKFVIHQTLKYAADNQYPLNSLEGFVRQIVGWREYVRAVYHLKGREQRTRNFWGFNEPIPKHFWDASTGIDPIDKTIRKVLETGYLHHIERLMVIGNFMLLCEFNPDEVYRWFMELFIDSYDWVMVPNVYGMSQFADGGLMATKPYISGSNYLLKMSNFRNGHWQVVWDGLFWRFIINHRSYFSNNPRLNVLVSAYDKMDCVRRNTIMQAANDFLNSLNK